MPVAPKRTRGSSKSGPQEIDMINGDDTSGATAKGTTPRPPMMNGQQQMFPGQLGQGVSQAGPQEWEWLTMSL
jgi:GATA-binding protein